MAKKQSKPVIDESQQEMADLFSDIERKEAACQAMEKNWISKREDAKVAKEAYQEAVDGLRRLARARQEVSPLFQGDDYDD